uniref:SAGA-associated factor 11 n=1 Tax=Parascaris univalens TaxID=6257 RepID=A0A914ZM21_PARUN
MIHCQTAVMSNFREESVPQSAKAVRPQTLSECKRLYCRWHSNYWLPNFVSALKEEPSSQLEEFDIFGNANIPQKPQKNMEVYCDECKRTIAASRFAPHLEKCMGMGRNSSRVARRRLANYVCSLKGSSSTGRLRDSLGRDSDVDRSDDDSRHTLPDDDDDWTSSRKTRKSRKSKVRNKPRSTRSRLNVEKCEGDDDSRGSVESAYELRK